jgi:DNA-binding FadR family transcriptional regulator
VPPANEWNLLDPVMFSWVKASGHAEVPIEHLFTFRSAVEPAATAEVALRAMPEQVATIKAALEAVVAAKTNFTKWIKADIDFHTAIYTAFNNVFMAPPADRFHEYFQMSFSVSSSKMHHLHCLQEHADVFDAIARIPRRHTASQRCCSGVRTRMSEPCWPREDAACRRALAPPAQPGRAQTAPRDLRWSAQQATSWRSGRGVPRPARS